MQHAVFAVTRAAALALLVACAACGSPSPTIGLVDTSPAGNVIELVSITPERGTQLRPDQTVTFTAMVNHTFVTSPNGFLVLFVVNEFGVNLKGPGATIQVDVARGRGSTTLSETITVPRSGGRTVIVSLVLSGERTEDVWVSARYPVG